MRVLLGLLLVMVLFLGIDRGMSQSKPETGGKSPEFSLHISPPQQAVKAGSAIRVDVNMTNVSAHAISYSKPRVERGRAEFMYRRVAIHDSQGGSPPMTELGRATFGQSLPGENLNTFDVSEMVVPLGRGESVTDFMIISNLYDLSRPGSYAVMLQHWDPSTKTEVHSNTIIIKVTP